MSQHGSHQSHPSPSGHATSTTAASHGASHGQSAGGEVPPTVGTVDVCERGAERDGQPQVMDRRLFMQFLAFHCDAGPTAAVEKLELGLRARGVSAVIYDDVNDPSGIGVLTWSDEPAHFVTAVRPVLAAMGREIAIRSDLSMLGRTYSTGYEQELSFWMLDRPQQTVLHPEHDWAIWYPLRRSGAFAKLEPREQGSILREHGTIGRAYGAQDLAHDIRLACHGLDARDNEFVIGLVGKALHPLSHIVQTMRKTRQTSEFISQMGPFFVGRVAARIGPF